LRAAPLMGAWVGEEVNTQDYEKLFLRDLETTQAIAKQMSNAALKSEPLQGAALRALRHFLE